MDWIEVKDPNNARNELPKEKQFFGIWKGVFCIAEYDEDEDSFYINFFPSQNLESWKLIQEREGKFTHYMIPVYPDGW